MRRISTNTLKPGMQLSLPIRNENSNILLNRNVELTARYIQRLDDLGFQTVYISDPDLLDVDYQEMISDQVRYESVKRLNQTHASVKKVIRDFKGDSVGKILENLKSNTVNKALKSIGIYANVSRSVENIVDEVVPSATLNGLNSLKTHDNYSFNHSIDVTIISVLIGKKTGLNVRQLMELATGCLLHDIGKVFIPQNLLNKNSKLIGEEYELIKEHTTMGYELLKDSLPIMPTHIAYQHHERQNGSGYPLGLKGCNTINRQDTANQIAIYGEISAVADVYDALSSDRPYRKSLPHDQEVDIIKDSAYAHLNAEIVKEFLNIVPRYPAGSNFEVVSGKYVGFKGVVISMNELSLNNPNIRLLFDARGNRIEPVNVNLEKQIDTKIKIIND